MWLTGLVAPRDAGSSQTRAQTRVPCIGRQILNHCTTREAPKVYFFREDLYLLLLSIYVYLWYYEPKSLYSTFLALRGTEIVLTLASNPCEDRIVVRNS